MAAVLRTRDGMPSVVGMSIAKEERRTDLIEIDLQEAVKWAKENRVSLKGEKKPLEKINTHRVFNGLPPFSIKRSSEKDQGLKEAKAVGYISRQATVPILAQSEEAFLELVASHNGTITAIVTPETAGWLIAINTENRTLQRASVERFKLILKTGKWVNTGEAIIVAREAILNDGQHRLHAIKETGISAEMDVRFGIPREAFHATGTGRKRTAADVLGMEGFSNTSCQAGIARLLILYDYNKMGELRTTVEPGEILSIVTKNELIGHIAAKINLYKMRFAKTSAFGFALALAARTAPIYKVFEFSGIAAGGLAKSDTDPAWCLQKRFQDFNSVRERLPQEDIAAYAIKAWNAWNKGEELHQLRVTPVERTNAGFPRVSNWTQSEDNTVKAA